MNARLWTASARIELEECSVLSLIGGLDPFHVVAYRSQRQHIRRSYELTCPCARSARHLRVYTLKRIVWTCCCWFCCIATQKVRKKKSKCSYGFFRPPQKQQWVNKTRQTGVQKETKAIKYKTMALTQVYSAFKCSSMRQFKVNVQQHQQQVEEENYARTRARATTTAASSSHTNVNQHSCMYVCISIYRCVSVCVFVCSQHELVNVDRYCIGRVGAS